MNLDGRAAAICAWHQEPLSHGFDASSNAFGTFINRDFFNLTQPETQAERTAISQFLYRSSIRTRPRTAWGQEAADTCWPPLGYHPEITRALSAASERWERP
jgi:hypothetical protein